MGMTFTKSVQKNIAKFKNVGMVRHSYIIFLKNSSVESLPSRLYRFKRKRQSGSFGVIILIPSIQEKLERKPVFLRTRSLSALKFPKG